MIFKKLLSSVLLLIFAALTFAQKHHDRFESIDVQHYTFEIHLNDTTFKIEAKTSVSVMFLKPAKSFVLDLMNTNDNGKGMIVNSIKCNNSALKFNHQNNSLEIKLNKTVKAGEMASFEISYSGIPADGLVISKNRYDERTFFGDNWPDRAKHWLPTVDHPSDKATLEFLVYAPNHYEVVSNGYLLEKKQLDNDIEFTHWKEDVPLSTKLMVIGAADFAVGNKSKYNNIPVSSWVFEQNKDQGLENYKYGTEALEFFSELIGAYSYEKLAHVQSKTRYGGMENAGCIFYHERTATSDNSQEGLFAHEVAHQWFGNSVTEQNWHHVWLSEGFATYLTHVYKQHFYGEEIFLDGLKNDRERVIRYANRNLAPIIDTTVTEYIHLLNANSYQKASWFLHMLRMDLGDEIFFEGLQKYYAKFQNSTVLTKDFQEVMETVAGKDMDLFFKQWLWQPGHPVMTFTSKINENTKKVFVTVNQVQTGLIYHVPIEVKIIYKDGSSEQKQLFMDELNKEVTFTFDYKTGNYTLILDPDVKLLYETENDRLKHSSVNLR